jgi:basic membrane lipoprotein Med (substrate-binding protein (PBP1-ABC) superfamily)
MPDTVVTSMVKRVDVAVLETIRAVTQHAFAGGMHELGLKDGAIDYVHDGPHAARVPDEVKRKIDDMKTSVIQGKIAVAADSTALRLWGSVEVETAPARAWHASRFGSNLPAKADLQEVGRALMGAV